MYPPLSWDATFCSRRQGTTTWAVSLTGSALVPCGFRQATAPNGTPGWAMGGGLPPPGLYRTRRLSWASGYFYLSTDQRQRNVGAGRVRLTPRRTERDAPRLRRGDTQGGYAPLGRFFGYFLIGEKVTPAERRPRRRRRQKSPLPEDPGGDGRSAQELHLGRAHEVDALVAVVGQYQHVAQGAQQGDPLEDELACGQGDLPAQVVVGQQGQNAGGAAAVVAVALAGAKSVNRS